MTALMHGTGHELAARDPLRLAAAFLAGYAENTRAAYWRDLKHLAAWCATRELDVLELERAHVDVYAAWCRDLEGVSAATIARRLAAIAGFYRYAVDEGVLARSPAERVRRPKVADQSPRAGLDRGEAASLLRAADAECPRDAAVIGLLLLNGLRASEVGQLDAAALGTDRGHRVLTVHGKGGRIDRIPLAPRVAAALDDHLQGRTTGPLITANDGGRLDRHHITRIVQRIARAAGISHRPDPDRRGRMRQVRRVCPHDLRHAHVTHALKAGVPLHVVQDSARHADPRTTRRYDRAAGSLDEHATYRLAAYVSETSQ